MKKIEEKNFDILYTTTENKLILYKNQAFRFTGIDYFILIDNTYTIRKLKSKFKFYSDNSIYELRIYSMSILQNNKITELKNWKNQLSFFLYEKDFNRLCDFLKIKKIIEPPRIEINVK